MMFRGSPMPSSAKLPVDADIIYKLQEACLIKSLASFPRLEYAVKGQHKRTTTLPRKQRLPIMPEIMKKIHLV